MNLMPNITCLSFNGFSVSQNVSQLKIESALLELLVFIRIKAEQLCRAMPAGHLGFVERHQQSEAQHFFAEVPLVQSGAQDRLVKMLQVGQRELRRQQLEADGLITHLALQ